MSPVKHIVAFLFLFALLFCAGNLNGEVPPGQKKRGNGYRYNIGTGLNFYHLNEKHGFNPKQRLSGTIGFRREIRVTKDFKTYLLFGADYVVHGLNYKSYFFKPDSVKIYNRQFSYDYALTIHEIHIPFQIKYLLRREDNSLFSPYLLFGYHLRYLLPGNVKVRKDGQLWKEDRPDLRFRTYLFSPYVNASLGASLGWQINRLGDVKGGFFAEANFQYGFSDLYYESEYSASNMFINNTQFTFLIGAKF